MIKFLLESEKHSPIEHIYTSISLAARFDQKDSLELLALDKRVKLPLDRVIKDSNFKYSETAKLLIRSNKVNDDIMFKWYCKKNQDELVEFMLNERLTNLIGNIKPVGEVIFSGLLICCKYNNLKSAQGFQDKHEIKTSYIIFSYFEKFNNNSLEISKLCP